MSAPLVVRLDADHAPTPRLAPRAPVLRRAFQIVFRMVPYPTESRLIVIGRPDRRSPVLVTTDYDLTVRRVVAALKNVDCYLLVAPAGGLDVWCAAGGGRFSIDSIVSILKTSRIIELVDHRRLILPQLAANGIDVFELKRRTGWTGVFGPVRVEDVPEYLQTRRKTVAMTRVTFTPLERIEMATAMWGSLSLRYTLFPMLVFGWAAGPRFIGSVAVLSLATSLGCFVLPGQTFVQKTGLVGIAVALAVLAALGLSGGWDPMRAGEWTVLLLFAAFLVGTAFPSYSPYWPCGYSKLFYGASELELRVDDEQCIGCRICDRVCPVDCFAISPGRTMAFVNPDECVGCGACLRQCPTGAIVNEVADQQLREGVCV